MKTTVQLYIPALFNSPLKLVNPINNPSCTCCHLCHPTFYNCVHDDDYGFNCVHDNDYDFNFVHDDDEEHVHVDYDGDDHDAEC